MDSLANYGSDDDLDESPRPTKSASNYGSSNQRSAAQGSQADVNYEEVQMDLSEESDGSSSNDDDPRSSYSKHQYNNKDKSGQKWRDESRETSSRDRLTNRDREDHYRDKDDYRDKRKGSDASRSSRDSPPTRHSQSKTNDDDRYSRRSDKDDDRYKRDDDKYRKDDDRHRRSNEEDRQKKGDDEDRYRDNRVRDRDSKYSRERDSSYKDRYGRDSRDKTRDDRRRRSSSRDRRDNRRRSRSRSRSGSRERSKPYSRKYDRTSSKMAHLEKLGIDIKAGEGKYGNSMDRSSDDYKGGQDNRFFMPGITGRFREQIERRKLLWQKKEPEKPVQPAASTSDNARTGKLWEATTFAQDSDGKVANKFKRLMGIKEAAPDPAKPTTDILKQQEEMFTSMEKQYEVARTATHTMRGVGLGFGSFQR